MPIRDDIYKEIKEQKNTAQDIVRKKYLKSLHAHTKRDTIIYASNNSPRRMVPVPVSILSINNEDIQGFMSAIHGLKGKQLDLILHSGGGSLEAADQIVQYLRSKYDHIRAIIPQNAMSAATMIACACDEIVMGKHSALGPIDPQITLQTQAGPYSVPAQAILDEFLMMRGEVLTNPMLAHIWAPKINSYPPGFLKNCETTILLSKEKVAEWLNKYMFGSDQEKKGVEIAEWLGKATEHKTHGRPIGHDLAKSKGLKITALEDDQVFQDRVLSVFHATMAAFDFSGCVKLIQNQNGKGTLINAELRQVLVPGQSPPSTNTDF